MKIYKIVLYFVTILLSTCYKLEIFLLKFNLLLLRRIKRKLRDIYEYYDTDWEPSADTMFNFRPFELVRVKYPKKASTKTTGTSSPAVSSSFFYPKARSGHRIVCTNTSLYCFGGFNPQRSRSEDDEEQLNCLFPELLEFNLASKKWTLMLGSKNEFYENTLPRELASNAMTLLGDTLMVYGGTGYPFGISCSNKLHVCRLNQKDKKLEEIVASGDMPTPQYGSSIVCHENYLYTIGGTEGFAYTCDVHRLNLLTRVWECVYICRCDIRESDPPGRYRHEIAYDGANIYIFGGGTSTQAFDLMDIPTYNIEANTWEYTRTNPDPLLADPGCYPDSRKCHSCIQFDTAEGLEVVIAGGFDGRRHFTDIWKLNLPTMTWHKFQTTALPQPLFFHDAAAHQDGCMYIFGGIKQDDGNTVRTNSIYKMYVTLPKLKVMAYEALLHYYSKRLRNLTKCQLLELGLPVVYAERLVADGRSAE